MSGTADGAAARFFQALGDPTRLALLEELRRGERHVGELVSALRCPQPKISRHLKVLKDAGLVRDQREGRHVSYGLSSSRAWPPAAREWLDRLELGLALKSAADRPSAEPASLPAPASPRPTAPPRAAAPARTHARGMDLHLL